MSGNNYTQLSLVATATTDVIDCTNNTLVGVYVPSLTSTSFTITAFNPTSGTYIPVGDCLGIYGSTGTVVTFTIAASTARFYPIPPSLTAGLQMIKLVFSSSETAKINVVTRNIP